MLGSALVADDDLVAVVIRSAWRISGSNGSDLPLCAALTGSCAMWNAVSDNHGGGRRGDRAFPKSGFERRYFWR